MTYLTSREADSDNTELAARSEELWLNHRSGRHLEKGLRGLCEVYIAMPGRAVVNECRRSGARRGIRDGDG